MLKNTELTHFDETRERIEREKRSVLQEYVSIEASSLTPQIAK